MRWLLLTAAMLLTGCPIDYCRYNGEPEVQFGFGVDGEWSPYVEGQPLEVIQAPSGGLGVDSILRTTGLETDEFVDARLEIWVEGTLDGRLSASFPSSCHATDWGALVLDTFIPLDPDTYPDTESVLALEGKPAELRVLVTDRDGNEGATGLNISLRL